MVASCLDLDRSAGSSARRGAEAGAARGLIGARPKDVGLVTVSPAFPDRRTRGRRALAIEERRCRMKELAECNREAQVYLWG